MNRPTLRTISRLLAPWRAIRRLERRNKCLSEALASPTMTGLAIHQNSATLGVAGPGAQMLAGMFLGLLQDNPQAVNYVELTFDSPEGNILVTVHRPGGATPHNLRAMAEQEARNLRAELARLQGDPGLHRLGTAQAPVASYQLHPDRIGWQPPPPPPTRTTWALPS
jgi:hypothetical protein